MKLEDDGVLASRRSAAQRCRLELPLRGSLERYLSGPLQKWLFR
jgi:hypothetical protein